MSGRAQGRGRGRGRGGGRGNTRGKGGRGRGQQTSHQRNNNHRSKDVQEDSTIRRKILLLHGNRQTGELLLGRMDKLKKTLLRECQLEIVAPDAPHLFSSDDELDCDDMNGNDASSSSQWQRTWWHRRGNTYTGLEKSLSLLEQIWNDHDGDFVGIMGFSQGSRLAHIIAILHTITNGRAFPGLKSIIHFSGYGDVPMADNFYTLLQEKWSAHIPQYTLMKMSDDTSYQFEDAQIDRPSLHVMGETDKLIPLQSSEALLTWYEHPSIHVHPGNHFVPVKKGDILRYLQFFNDVETMNMQPSISPAVAIDECPVTTTDSSSQDTIAANTDAEKDTVQMFEPPDEEHSQAQIDEVTAISLIFPTEFNLTSQSTPKDPANYDPDDYSEENRTYEHPIKYTIVLQPQDSIEEIDEKLWPPKNISLCVDYPSAYPDSSPTIRLIHEMNYFEFSLQASEALLDVCSKAMEEEFGMPCVMGMIYAARDFFEGGGLFTIAAKKQSPGEANEDTEAETAGEQVQAQSTTSLLRPSSAARIEKCNAQGLQVASTMLGRSQTNANEDGATVDRTIAGGKGGRWMYTIGLVGKPSAGKSTFFNAATGFARQRGEGGGEARCEDAGMNDEESEVVLGGASMAPHPFTTIDPNIGYCLVPAPQGSCPEDEEDCQEKLLESSLTLGSTHGRDSKGRRLIPVLLKDVAGLVPGAYQGRGRGNKFLDDLTDSDALIHVVNASGSSDAEGNDLHNDLVNPINDLQWVRNELVEWVYFNLSSKWDSVLRRGRQKLIGMFSGYKQREAFTYEVLLEVERFVQENEGRELDLEAFDEGDLHRLVSAFLGARFPMALALNKSDLPSAQAYIKEIQSKLPIHGAHVGVSMSAHSEMAFIRHHLIASSSQSTGSNNGLTSGRVFDCLQSAMSLRQPVLVFPVNDFVTYEPLPGLQNHATRDASLPNHGFITCVCASGGIAPSHWNNERKMYIPSTKSDAKPALRDMIMMKQNSTVEDVFRSLKGMSVLEGDFVRAEGSSKIGERPKPLTKSNVVGRHNRILRIMTTKRQAWQQK